MVVIKTNPEQNDHSFRTFQHACETKNKAKVKRMIANGYPVETRLSTTFHCLVNFNMFKVAWNVLQNTNQNSIGAMFLTYDDGEMYKPNGPISKILTAWDHKTSEWKYALKIVTEFVARFNPNFLITCAVRCLKFNNIYFLIRNNYSSWLTLLRTKTIANCFKVDDFDLIDLILKIDQDRNICMGNVIHAYCEMKNGARALSDSDRKRLEKKLLQICKLYRHRLTGMCIETMYFSTDSMSGIETLIVTVPVIEYLIVNNMLALLKYLVSIGAILIEPHPIKVLTLREYKNNEAFAYCVRHGLLSKDLYLKTVEKFCLSHSWRIDTKLDIRKIICCLCGSQANKFRVLETGCKTVEHLCAVDIRKLPCGHVCHLECLMPYLDYKFTCPKCRKPIL